MIGFGHRRIAWIKFSKRAIRETLHTLVPCVYLSEEQQRQAIAAASTKAMEPALKHSGKTSDKSHPVAKQFSEEDMEQIKRYGQAPSGSPTCFDEEVEKHLIEPMQASSIKKPFDSPDWIFETKLDGYRAIAVIDSTGKTRIWSRNHLPLEPKFPTVGDAVNKLGLRSTILAGEIVALRKFL